MSIAKRIWEIEQMAGMDPAVGSTSRNGIASYEWIIDADHMENLDFFMQALRDEFSEEAVSISESKDGDARIGLIFNYPYANLDFEIDMAVLKNTVYCVIHKLDKEIQGRQEITGQSFALTMEVSREIAQIKFAGIVLWSSLEASGNELYDEDALEARIREELGKVVETVKMVEGIG